MSDAILKLDHVYRSYKQGDGELCVLKDINLEIKKGQMVAIVGPSGSGKSTLMNIIGCLDTPSKGSYLVGGQDTANMLADELASLRRNFFGFIFQRYHLLGHLNAKENVEVPAIYAGLKTDVRDVRALNLLTSLGLNTRSLHKPSQLSGGQQQRVSIARALMNGGQIILADEPTGALDSKSGVEVMNILKALNAKGHTIIIVTHDLKVAKSAKRIISIEDGMIKSDIINEDYAVDQTLDGNVLNEGTVIDKEHTSFRFKAFIDRFKEAFDMATRAMIANRMRTLLTMLGIIIGIMAVVSVVALGRGASQRVLENISSLGTNTITIYPGAKMGDVHKGKVRTLVPQDLDAIAAQDFVDSASPSIQISVLLRYANLEFDGSAQGVTSDLFRVFGYTLQQGRFFSSYEVNENAQVCIIDSNTKDNLFLNEDPIGKKILVNNISATIIGVLDKVDSPFLRPDSLNVFMPYTAVSSRIINQNYLSSIIVRVKDNYAVAVAENNIIALLKARHNGLQDFFFFSSDSIMKSISATTQTFTILIGAIAVISLVVGGIGVMNIMLVSVTERTKEIGIRMAVGARRFDIMSQFLIEAVLVCLVGGSLGVILSYCLSFIVQAINPAIYMSFSLYAIIAAVVTSTLIGIIFGFMPARSASRLNPIDALSYE